MRDITKYPHDRIAALDIMQKVRLKFVLQRTFRAHAKLDPALAPDNLTLVPEMPSLKG